MEIRSIHAEVFNIIKNKYPNRPIPRSTMSKVEIKFTTLYNVADIYKKCLPMTTEDLRLNVLFTLQENPHKPTLQIPRQNNVPDICFKSLKKVNKW